ncbi:MAG: hypothetical protein WCY55_07050 [Anaerovoracaceae bacterium]
MSKILKSESFLVHAKDDEAMSVSQQELQGPRGKIIEQALQKSKLICQEAQKRAAELIASAEEDCLHIRVEAEQRGYREGYRSGVLEGALEARRASEQGLEEMQELLEALREEKRIIASENLRDIIDISFEISKKIMRQHVETDEKAVENMVCDIISEHESGIKIYLSEYSRTLDASVDRNIAKRLTSRTQGTKIIVTQHEDLLMVETEDGVTDMSVPTQLKQLKEALDSE